jgi:tetratricopeptide (TPR) repeat protein
MDIEGHDQLANDLSALGDNQDAIEVMRQWVKEQSSLAPARRDKPGNLHELLGNFYFSAGSYALAVREYEEAMALAPDAQIKQDLDAAKLKLQVTPSR